MSRSHSERRPHAEVDQLAAKQTLLATFPLRLDFDHGKASVAVTGIEPSQLETAPLIDALAAAAAPYRIVNRIGLVSAPDQLAASQASIAESLKRLQASLDQMREAMSAQAKSGDQKIAGLTAQYDKLGEQYAKLGEQFTKLQSVADGPTARLDRFISSTAIFFANNSDEVLYNDQAEQQLRELAGLLANSDLKIRVVGYADQSGTEGTNKTLGRKRAEQLPRSLTALGAIPSRLILVSRAAAMPIADRRDATVGGNRRVAFETVYRGEVAR